MAGVRSSRRGTKYEGWYLDWRGERVFFAGTPNKAETRRMAKHLEDQHSQIRLGLRPPPSSVNKNCKRPFGEVRDEYLEWGQMQGGRNRKPWSAKHYHNRSVQLEWWSTQLNFELLGEVATADLLGRIEKALELGSNGV